MMTLFRLPFFSFLLGMSLLGCLSSCTFRRLDVQTRYLSHENLASYYVRTPDPALEHPTIGQRLLIQWSLPKQDFDGEKVQLYLKLRFRNHQEQEIIRTLCKNRGVYLYDLTNQAYCKSGGLLTYRVEIRQGDCVVESWTHPLWTTLIQFDFSENKTGGVDNENHDFERVDGVDFGNNC